MSLKHEYSELSQDEEKLSFTSSQVLEESSERAWRRFTVGASKLSIYLLALLGVLSIGNILLTFVWHNRPAPEILTPEQHPQLFSYPQVATTFSLRPELKEGFIQLPLRRSCRCGATISEALSNNCRYDSHATAWLPPHCLDEELLAEWEQAGPGPNGTWEYYADADGTQPLSVEEVAMLPKTDGFFWMTQEWHVMVSTARAWFLADTCAWRGLCSYSDIYC